MIPLQCATFSVLAVMTLKDQLDMLHRCVKMVMVHSIKLGHKSKLTETIKLKNFFTVNINILKFTRLT